MLCHSTAKKGGVMYLVVGAVLGYVLGLALKHSIFAAKRGASTVVSLILAPLVWVVSILSFAIYADLVLGAKSQPSWVGLTSAFAAVAFFMSVRRK